MSNLNTETVERYHQHIVSIEMVTDFTPGQPAMKRLGQMFGGTKAFISQLFSSFSLSADNKIDLTKLIGIAETQSFAAMSKVPVSQPLRLTKPWVEYATALDTLQRITENIDKELLQPFNAYVGKALNQPSLLDTLTFEPKGYRFTDVKPYKKELTKFLNGPNKEHVAWSVAFNRNADVRSFAEKFNEILIRHSNLRPETVTEAVKKLNDNLDSLMKEVNDPNSQYVMNKKTTLKMSEMILQLAEHVELYTITHNLIVEMERCALETQEAINFK